MSARQRDRGFQASCFHRNIILTARYERKCFHKSTGIQVRDYSKQETEKWEEKHWRDTEKDNLILSALPLLQKCTVQCQERSLWSGSSLTGEGEQNEQPNLPKTRAPAPLPQITAPSPPTCRYQHQSYSWHLAHPQTTTSYTPVNPGTMPTHLQTPTPGLLTGQQQAHTCTLPAGLVRIPGWANW